MTAPSEEHVHAADRHAALVAELRLAVLDGPGTSDRAARAEAAAPTQGGGLPPLTAAYVAKVRDESYRIADADVTALESAGHSEDEIFEITVAAALGAALSSLDAGLAALRGRA